jgi:hypothetical protein
LKTTIHQSIAAYAIIDTSLALLLNLSDNYLNQGQTKTVFLTQERNGPGGI